MFDLELLQEINYRKLGARFKENEDETIEMILSLPINENEKKSIEKSFESYKKVKNIDESVKELALKKLLNNIYNIEIHEIIANQPLDDLEVEGIVKDLVSKFLYYDRKSDDVVNPDRIQNYFSKNPSKISNIAKVFEIQIKKYLGIE